MTTNTLKTVLIFCNQTRHFTAIVPTRYKSNTTGLGSGKVAIPLKCEKDGDFLKKCTWPLTSNHVTSLAKQ